MARIVILTFASTVLCGQNPSERGLGALEAEMVRQMEKWHLPGGQLAIAFDGRLVLSRGYGLGDVEAKQPVGPESLFRVGSVSKTLTAVAILQLVERGRLRLDDRAFRVLSNLRPPKSGRVADPRIFDITIRHLLRHEGGWDEHDLLELPWSRRAALAVGGPDPPSCETIVRYALGKPLDFPPGAKVSYSNFGYCVLGRVIEAVSGLAYEEYVEREILAPAGVRGPRLAGTRLRERASGEVRYYAQPGRPLAPSVYPGEGDVPFAYGGFYMRAGDASGGWIASAENLVRFADAIGRGLIRPETVRRMLEEQLCWTVVKRSDGADYWHTGALKDSHAAWLVRTSEGATLAFTFNSVPPDPAAFLGDIVPALLDLLKQPARRR